MIEARHLTKWYGNILAVDDVSFQIAKGQIVGFLGPNGAGKSTTLKMLTCYLPATMGSATVDGHDVLTDSLAVRRKIGYMAESVPMYPEMRVREFLNFRAALRDIPAAQRSTAIDRVAERCWLTSPQDVMRRRIGELSRGYKQRVALAEVLLHNPPVLILDEPTIGLDPAQIRAMRDLIRGLAPEHTVIFSSHILAEVEATCTNLIIIAGGRIAAAGTLDQLRQRVAGARVVAEVRGADEQAMAKAVESLPSVGHVGHEHVGNWTRLTIQAAGEGDCRAEIFKLISERGWQLRELRRESGSLEDYFVQITYQQNINAFRPAAAAVAS